MSLPNPGVHSGTLSTVMKTVAILSAVIIFLVLGISLLAAFTGEAERNNVDLSYGSVAEEVRPGETFSESAGYSPVDVFARLNWKFRTEDEWYGEYHGFVDTVVSQDVQTYKYYRDGMLLSADLTKSSLVNAARQFCYVRDEDRVIWREARGGASTYNGMDTPWSTDRPKDSAIKSISGPGGFKAENGLPAYELSVYVIEPDTILESSIEPIGDGLWRVNFVMNTENWEDTDENGDTVTKGATAYYINQMIFTGGLPEAPVFTSLSVSFTFDENWRTYKSEVLEKYSAAYGPINAPCNAGGTTEYEYYHYDAANPYPTAYEDYFRYYMDEEVHDGPSERELTAIDCLASAFGGLLTEPSALDLSLDLGGAQVPGRLFVDLSGVDLDNFALSALDVRAKIGALGVWLKEGRIYLSYGGVKLSLDLNDIASLLPSGAETRAEGGGGADDILAALGNGEFHEGDGTAELHVLLPLSGIEIPLDFYFFVDAEKNVTFDRAELALALSEDFSLAAEITFGEGELPALPEAEEAYPDASASLASLVELFSSQGLRLDASYAGDGFTVAASADVTLSPLSAMGTVSVTAGGSEKTAEVAYLGGMLYLTLDGLRLSADLEEGMALLEEYLGLSADVAAPDLSSLIATLFTEEFASGFASAEGEGLEVSLDGTALAELFGIELELGRVTLAVGDGSLTLTAEALGCEATVTKGEPFDFEPEGYVPVVEYLGTVLDLVQSDYLRVDVSLSEGGLTVSGEIDIDPAKVAVRALLTLSYGESSKLVSIYYGEDALYLAVDGIRLKVDLEQAEGLLAALTGSEGAEERDLLERILFLDFSKIVPAIFESDGALHLILASRELFGLFELDLDLGDIRLSVSDEGVSAVFVGGGLTLGKGEAFTADTENYIELNPYAEAISKLIEANYLTAEIAYEGGNLCVSGTISLSLDPLAAKGEFTIVYRDGEEVTENHIGVVYSAEGDLGLCIGDLKIRADLNEAIALIEALIARTSAEPAAAALTEEELSVLERLLSIDLSELLTVSESEGVLSVMVAGTRLMQLFGSDFDLGDVNVTLSEEGGVTLVLDGVGVRASLSEGTQFDTQWDPETYIDVVKYAEMLKELFEGEAFGVDVYLHTGELEVAGTVRFAAEGGVVEGVLQLTYGTAQKEVGFFYQDGMFYLDLGGLKLKAGGAEAAALALAYIGLSGTDGVELNALENLFGVEFEGLIHLSESGDVLTILIDGTRLLKELGVDYELGDLALSVEAGSLTVAAEKLGLTAKLNAAEAPAAHAPEELEGYIDVSAYAETASEILGSKYLAITIAYDDEKGLHIGGTVSIDTEKGQMRADLTIERGETQVSLGAVYAEGGMLYLDLDGAKIKANVEDAAAFIRGLSSGAAGAAMTYALAGNEVQAIALTEEQLSVIERILSLNLDDYFTLAEDEEHNVLTLTVAGTELIEAVLGRRVELGEVEVTVTRAAENGAGKIALNVRGMDIALQPGEAFELFPAGDSEETYIDILQYVEWAAQILRSEYFTADVTFAAEELTLAADLDIAVDGSFVRGTIYLSYRTVERKPIGFIYTATDGMIYLDVDGVKIKAEAARLASLLGDILKRETGTAPEGAEIAVLRSAAKSVEAFGLFSLDEAEGTLGLSINGAKLLELLGLDGIALDEVRVGISETTLTLAISGDITASVALTGSEEFHLGEGETDGYIDVVKYADMVGRIFENPTLLVELETKIGNTDLDVNFKFNRDFSYAQGAVRIGNFAFDVIYVPTEAGETELYLTIQDLKLKANVDEAIRLIENMRNPAAGISEETKTALEKVLGLKFGELIQLSEEITEAGGDALSVTVAAGRLFEALGVGLNVETISVTLEEGVITLRADENTTVVLAGTTALLKLETPEDYKDVTHIIDRLCNLITARAIEFRGAFYLDEPFVEIERGIVSWAEEGNVRVYLKGAIDGALRFEFTMNGGLCKLGIAFGETSFGIEFVAEDFGKLADSVRGLIGRIRSVVEKVQTSVHVELASLVSTLQGLIGALQGGLDILTPVAANLAAPAALTLDNAGANVLAKLTVGSFSLTLLDETADERYDGEEFTQYLGLLGLELSAQDAFRVELHAGVFYEQDSNPFPVLDAENTFRNIGEIADQIDAFGAAIGLLAEDELQYRITGTDKVNYNFAVDLDYRSGEAFPVHLEMTDSGEGGHVRNFWIDTELFAHITLTLEALTDQGTDLWLDLYVLDADANGELDFYVSVSTAGKVDPDTGVDTPFEEGGAAFAPLRLYAPAGEISQLLSSAAVMLGLDDLEIAYDFLIAPFLETNGDVAGQLRGIGDFLLPLLSNLMANAGSGSAAETPAPEPEVPALLAALGSVTGTGDTSVFFGDVEVTFKREFRETTGEDGKPITTSYLTGLTVGDYAEVTIARETVEAAVPGADSYLNLNGIDQLLFSLAKSATHENANAGEVISGEETAHTYSLNNNFYIDGDANVTLNIDVPRIGTLADVSVAVKLIAVSVTIDENGDLGLNVRLGLDAMKVLLVIPVINGDTTVDLTLKNGMVYIKRVLTSKYDRLGREQDCNETLYRAMPSATFMANILDQIPFLFNLNDTIWGAINGIIQRTDGGDKTAVYDIGAYLSGYTFTEAAGGAGPQWKVVLNGDTLIKNDSFGAITLTLGADESGYIRNITANMKITDAVTITANLHWRNPGGVMEENVTEQTDSNLAALFESRTAGMGAMIEKYNAEGWGDVVLEAVPRTVEYRYRLYGGETRTLGTQDVMVSSSSSGAILYSELVYPDLSSLDDGREFYVSWPDQKILPGDAAPTAVEAQQYKYRYDVTFLSDHAFEGWAMDDATGLYKFVQSMEYGSQIRFVAGGADFSAPQYASNDPQYRTIRLPSIEKIGYKSQWLGCTIDERGATFTAQFDPILRPVQFTGEGSETPDLFPTELPYDTLIEFVDESGETVLTCKVGPFENVFELPAREGYDASYELVSKGDQSIVYRVTYTPRLYDVTINDADGAQVYTGQMYYDSTVEALDSNGTVLKTYTVGLVNEFTLPQLPVYRDESGDHADVRSRWEVNLDETGGTLTAAYILPTIVYHSDYEVNEWGGKEYTEQKLTFKEFDLSTEITSADYLFRGWYRTSSTSGIPVGDLTAEDFASDELHLYAHWEEKPILSVTVTSGNGTAAVSLTYDGNTVTGSGTYHLNPRTEVKYTITFEPPKGLFGVAQAYKWSWSISGAATGDASGSELNTRNAPSPISGSFWMPESGTVKVEAITAEPEESGGGGGGETCIAEGTLITLADGTQKPIEDLNPGDAVLVFNHETGMYEAGKMWFIDDIDEPANMHRILNLRFSDGTLLRISYQHALFDLDLNKYVFVNEDNMNEYLGHRFVKVENESGTFVNRETVLTEAYVTEEFIRVFGPITEYHFNLVTEDLLTMPSFNYNVQGMINIFEYGEGLKYDEEKMQADIEKYGLFTYEEFADLIPYDVWQKAPIAYFKVAIGKGNLTWEEIELTIDYLFGKGYA